MERYVPLPPLPARIERLNELACDLWWSWNPSAREVFRDLDYPLWRFTDHNPVLLLHLVDPERLIHASTDGAFLEAYDRAVAQLDAAREGAATWWAQQPQGPGVMAIVAPRFALHQSLPAPFEPASVLSADVCKEASDLGVPLVGVGLMYPRGYAHQRLSAEGWQQESYEYLDWSDTPARPARTPAGEMCRIVVPLAGREVRVNVWRVSLGRVSVYLLDTDAAANTLWDREIAGGAFDGDPDGRLRQALLLGAGSVAALKALGIEPVTWHLSGALAPFVSVARLHEAVHAGAAVPDALQAIRRSTVCWLRGRQPRAADAFTCAALDRQASGWPAWAAVRDTLLPLGTYETDRGGAFHPAVFGANTCRRVLAAHDEGTSGGHAWPQRQAASAAAAPHVTRAADGVHLPSWASADLAALFDQAVGTDWRDRQDDEAAWARLHDAPDGPIWEVCQRLRRYLVDFMRERARRSWAKERAGGTRLVALGTLLDGSALTIGCAQPFSDAGGPGFLFSDPARLAQILTAARRPVQIVFAGRARPGDEAGKHHLQRVFRHALDPVYGGRVAFLEDYDLHVARLLVQGCDVWLSVPRPGDPPLLEGILAAVNGAPHLGTRDAWRTDGWTGDNGWLIRARPDGVQGDAADARAVYTLLEDELVPAFYDRDRAGVPPRWLRFVKHAIADAVPRFCARRFVRTIAEEGRVPRTLPDPV